MADVSIVVPTRNRATLLERLLRQLVSLDAGPEYQIVVVDEGSSDHTPELLERYSRDHGIEVIRNDPPRGLSGARNTGIAATDAPFVTWIDDDDLTSPDRIARQLEALRSGPWRWSCAARVDVDDDLQVIGHVRCPAPDRLLSQVLGRNVLPSAGQGLLVERSLLDEVGTFDESLDSAEDWDFAIRLAESGPGHMLDEPLVGYRTGFASMSTDTDRMERTIARVVDRYADLYRREGVEADWAAIHQSLLAADLLNSPRRARSRAWRSFTSRPSPAAARRFLLVLLAPGWMSRRSAARRREQVPDSWVRQARGWLDLVATQG